MTDTPKAIEVNCETGVVTERDLTAAEIAEREAAAAAWAAEQEAKAAADAAAAVAKAALLAQLGITEEQAKLLLN